MACNDRGQLFCDFAKKLNCHPSSIEIFLKNHKKTKNYHQKEGCGQKRKTIASEDAKKLFGQLSDRVMQLKGKLK